MTVVPLVSRAEALKRPTHHQYLHGLGYLVHSGPPELPEAARGEKNCAPPDGVGNRSRHVLQPPGKHPPMTMIWHAGDGAWMHPAHKGNRMGWTPDHLSKAGWEYVGPVKPSKAKHA